MELKTVWTDNLSAFFLLKIPSRHTDSVCAVPAVRWVLCSSTDELGILLFCPWRDTVWTQTERQKTTSILGFIPAPRPCCWNAGTQSAVNCYGSFCEQFLGLQRKCFRWRIVFTDTFGVTDQGSNTCVALYQFSLEGEVVLFPWHFLPHWLMWNCQGCSQKFVSVTLESQ